MSVKVGFVGCGDIASSHLQAYQECGAKVVAVTDIKPEAARKMSSLTGADVYGDLRQLVDVARPDVISVCTPPVAHEEAAIYALGKGVNVLCEKPLAHTVESAYRIRNAAQKSTALFMPAFRHRFLPAIVAMKNVLVSGKIGEIVLFNNVFGGPAFDMEYKWFTKKNISGGGSILDTNSHSIDIFRFLLGEIIDQKAVMHRHFKTTDVEDAGILAVKAANGALGSLQSSFLLGSGAAYIDVIGTKGRAKYDYLEPDNICYHLMGEDDWREMQVVASTGFTEEIRHFLGAVAGEHVLACTVDDGVRAMEIIDSIYASCQPDIAVEKPI
jgi:predicted dehydrogenase